MNRELLAADFRRALAELAGALDGSPKSRLEQAGCIQYFEFCFELAWKFLKALAVHHGIDDAESPRGALRAAFAQRWVDDELVWLEMLECRNRMSHTYSSESALDVFERLGAFTVVLQRLGDRLEHLIQR